MQRFLAMPFLIMPLTLVAQSVPANGAAGSTAINLTQADLMQTLGVPKYTLDLCRQGDGFGCNFLTGLLRSADHNRLPEIFSTDLQLDDLRYRDFAADCEKEDPFACFQFGLELISNNFTTDSVQYKHAEQISRNACENKIWPGCLFLAAHYLSHDVTRKGKRTADDNLKRTCTNGLDMACRYHSAAAFFNALHDHVLKLEYENATLRALCNLGRAVHCTILGLSYSQGLPGIQQDHMKALLYFKRACTLNDGMGCEMVGFYYRHGLGVETNLAESNRWLNRACDLKAGFACSLIGTDLFDQSTNQLNEPDRAFKLFTGACDGESGMGCAMLARMYLLGVGTTADAEKGKALMGQACHLKFDLACQQIPSTGGDKK